MYVGRIVGAGRSPDGRLALGYRVSSRSFPNRTAQRHGESVRIIPRPGSADAASDSPYIAYECIVWNAHFAVASNGTHTRPIFERLKAGHSPRDSILGVLAGLDREFDALDTPRICSVADIRVGTLWLGSITATSISVMPMEVQAGQFAYVTTYEYPHPQASQIDSAFAASNAGGVCSHIVSGTIFAGFGKPICAAAVICGPGGIDIATLDVTA